MENIRKIDFYRLCAANDSGVPYRLVTDTEREIAKRNQYLRAYSGESGISSMWVYQSLERIDTHCILEVVRKSGYAGLADMLAAKAGLPKPDWLEDFVRIAVKLAVAMTPHPISISSSTARGSLTFPSRGMYSAYEKESQQLLEKYKLKIEAEYGIWASDQGRFVPTIDDLNRMDRR